MLRSPVVWGYLDYSLCFFFPISLSSCHCLDNSDFFFNPKRRMCLCKLTYCPDEDGNIDKNKKLNSTGIVIPNLICVFFLNLYVSITTCVWIWMLLLVFIFVAL